MSADAPSGRGPGVAHDPPTTTETGTEPDAEIDGDGHGDLTDRGSAAAGVALVPAPRSAPAEPDVDPYGSADQPDGPGARSGGGPAGPELTDREREILAFERRWWRHAGAKEQAIRDTFDLSATRYYQLLNGLLDKPAALAAEPMLVGRLRRLRSVRSRSRRR